MGRIRSGRGGWLDELALDEDGGGCELVDEVLLELTEELTLLELLELEFVAELTLEELEDRLELELATELRLEELEERLELELATELRLAELEERLELELLTDELLDVGPRTNVAWMLWLVWTLLKVKLSTAPKEVPSTIRSATR